MLKVYIAGPYSNGDVDANVRNAIKAGERLIKAGYIPYVPHLTHLWHTISPHGWDYWLSLDLQWLLACDYLLRLEGKSKGADLEVETAKEFTIPIFYSINDIIKEDK